MVRLPFDGAPIVTLPEATLPPVGNTCPANAGARPAMDAAVTTLRSVREKGGNTPPSKRLLRAMRAFDIVMEIPPTSRTMPAHPTSQAQDHDSLATAASSLSMTQTGQGAEGGQDLR